MKYFTLSEQSVSTFICFDIFLWQVSLKLTFSQYILISTKLHFLMENFSSVSHAAGSGTHTHFCCHVFLVVAATLSCGSSSFENVGLIMGLFFNVHFRKKNLMFSSWILPCNIGPDCEPLTHTDEQLLRPGVTLGQGACEKPLFSVAGNLLLGYFLSKKFP